MKSTEISVPLTVDGMSKSQVRAVADQMGKVAMRWHALAVEMDRLASLLTPIEESTTQMGEKECVE